MKQKFWRRNKRIPNRRKILSVVNYIWNASSGTNKKFAHKNGRIQDWKVEHYSRSSGQWTLRITWRSCCESWQLYCWQVFGLSLHCHVTKWQSCNHQSGSSVTVTWCSGLSRAICSVQFSKAAVFSITWPSFIKHIDFVLICFCKKSVQTDCRRCTPEQKWTRMFIKVQARTQPRDHAILRLVRWCSSSDW